jgi:hypothetical protein
MYGALWNCQPFLIFPGKQTEAKQSEVTYDMAKTRERKLPLLTNSKRTKLLQGVASGMNVSEAGRAAGYANAQSAHRSLHRIRLQLPDILDKMNIPVEKVVKKLKAQMEAMETLYFTHQGVVMETRQVEAHAIQLRAAVELAKMLGFYPGASTSAYESEPDNKVPGHISLTIVVGTPEEAKELGATFVHPRAKPKELSAGVKSNENLRRRPSPKPAP